jgi:hypothetical protein
MRVPSPQLQHDNLTTFEEGLASHVYVPLSAPGPGTRRRLGDGAGSISSPNSMGDVLRSQSIDVFVCFDVVSVFQHN